LLGVLFGGMVAVEIAKHIPIDKLLLLSTVKTRFELSSYYRFVGRLGILRFIPDYYFTRANRLTLWLFGVRDRAEQELMRQVLNETSPSFVKWALQHVVRWKNTECPARFTHIHGTKDRLFRVSSIKNAVLVKGGGHFMMLSQADDVSRLLREQLTDPDPDHE